MLLLSLTACLVNEDLYNQRRALLTDQDGDGITEEQGDCDDNDANRFPGAPELCDGEDDDCDTVIDEEGVDTFWYTDIDGDTFGDPLSEVESCQSPGDSYVQDKADCNDRDPAIHPGIEETCDGVDEDCDGTIDEGCGYGPGAVQVTASWETGADVDLAVTDPRGETVSATHRQVSSGGEIDREARAGCPRFDALAVEDVRWPEGAPAGQYTARVNIYDDCAVRTTTPVTLSVSARGRSLGTWRATFVRTGQSAELRFDVP